jgi:hypothetical protein
MAGFTPQEARATLDARFPTSGAGDHIGWSTDGATEFAGLARTAVGATGWAPATGADPSVKANAVTLLSANATAVGTVTHFAVFSASSGGIQRTIWKPLNDARALAVDDQLSAAVGTLGVTLT